MVIVLLSIILPIALGITSPYVRPAESPLLDMGHLRRAIGAQSSGCGDASCGTQVHIQLGGPREMVIVFASEDETTPSEVHYGTSTGMGNVAHGSMESYSSTLFFMYYGLINPSIGFAQEGAH